MSFGVYVHIPYCRQICPYCPFSKYKIGNTIHIDKYLSVLFKEIKQMSHLIKNPSSIYIGGGTPSVIGVQNLLLIVEALGDSIETTVEVDPATISPSDLDILLDSNINRISLGVQTMNDSFLQKIGRTHLKKDVLDLVKVLNKRNFNYGVDLLFALPNQKMDHLKKDLREFIDLGPKHISTYILEIPRRHTLSKMRPNEKQQVEMIQEINNSLEKAGFHRYELSNFSQKNYESKHNLVYWNDTSYVGLGLSAHSYIKDMGRWGIRFSNEKSMSKYVNKMEYNFINRKIEVLTMAESLTDYCHTQLRKIEGFSCNALFAKFGLFAKKLVLERSNMLADCGLVSVSKNVSLTDKGKLFSNKVFEKFLFVENDFELK